MEIKKTPKQIKQEYERLKSGRGIWEQHWQECADYIVPKKGNVTVQTSPGEKRGVRLLDNTAMQSNELLAGALHGLLTNPSNIFFGLTSGDPSVDVRDDVRKWFQKAVKQMHEVLNNSNFQTEVHELYIDLGCFGTAPMLIEDDPLFHVRFGSHTVAEVLIKENSRGYVNEVFRRFEWTAQQIVSEFGKEVPERILKAFKDGKEDKFGVIHNIYPADTDEEVLMKATFPYRSCYILDDVQKDDEAKLREKGYHEFPYVCPRWSKTSGETYGRSPGMTALPEAKTINAMTETMIKAAQKSVDPPLQAPDDGYILPLKTAPGSVNFRRRGLLDRIEPVFNKEIRVDFGEAIMREHRDRIRAAFYVDQLQLGTGPQMTATEVNQRTEEKMRLLGPMLGRMQSEFLQPLIDRVFGIMLRKDLIKDIPQALSGKSLRVQYSSTIAKLQRAQEAGDMLKTIKALEPFYNADPTIMDNFNGDRVVKTFAEIFGFPQAAMNDKKEVDGIRQGRAQAQQQAVQAQKESQEVDNMSKMAPAVGAMKQAMA